MDNQNIVRDEIAQIQELFFAILNVIYESDYPITLETIAYQIKQPCTSKLAYALSGLVATGHISVKILDGIVNYCKPTSLHFPLLPMPYYRMFDYF